MHLRKNRLPYKWNPKQGTRQSISGKEMPPNSSGYPPSRGSVRVGTSLLYPRTALAAVRAYNTYCSIYWAYCTSCCTYCFTHVPCTYYCRTCVPAAIYTLYVLQKIRGYEKCIPVGIMFRARKRRLPCKWKPQTGDTKNPRRETPPKMLETPLSRRYEKMSPGKTPSTQLKPQPGDTR